MDLSNHRKDYSAAQLIEANIQSNPFNQFRIWFQDCLDSKILEPNAFVLSTCLDNKPSSRVVLLKSFSEDEFVFYSNYKSKKGNEITLNPNVSFLFFWHELQRQVRIEGVLSKVDEEKSKEYFLSRPIDSQISAIVSNQSSNIENREELEKKVQNINRENIQKPKHWGGYSLSPNYFEFWQGRANRLHDRISYTQTNSVDWKIQRLAP